MRKKQLIIAGSVAVVSLTGVYLGLREVMWRVTFRRLAQSLADRPMDARKYMKCDRVLGEWM